MLRVALTGGIATGKSYVLSRLRGHGIVCLDADDLAHGAMAPGTEGARQIAERFGETVLLPDGSVDRRDLGALVFRDAVERRALEAIIHPAVFRAIEAALRGLALLNDTQVVVVAIPLLYETGRASDFDLVVATRCDVQTQRARLRDRGLGDEDAVLRLSSQLSALEKAKRADMVIDTEGSLAETDRQVASLVEALRVRADARAR